MQRLVLPVRSRVLASHMWKQDSELVANLLAAQKGEICRERPKRSILLSQIDAIDISFSHIVTAISKVVKVVAECDKDTIYFADDEVEIEVPLPKSKQKSVLPQKRNEIERATDPARYNSPNQRLETRDRIEKAYQA